MGAPSGVTPGRCGTGQVSADPTVRDSHRQRVTAGGWAARRGATGDVRGTGQIPVSAETARAAGEGPAAGLGQSPTARGAGGGGAPLIDQVPGDPGLASLVGQVADQGAGPPVAQPLVVAPPGLQGKHAARVTHRQSPHLPGHRPGDHLFGRFVLGLADPAPVADLGLALAGRYLRQRRDPTWPGLGVRWATARRRCLASRR